MYQLKFQSYCGQLNTLTVADFSDVVRSIRLVDSFVPFLSSSVNGTISVPFTLTRYRKSSRSLDLSSKSSYRVVWSLNSPDLFLVLDDNCTVVHKGHILG